MFANIGGLNIEYTESGIRDGIPVLLLHGWGSSFDVYRSVMNGLADRCRLVALNFPGCGKSDVMKEPWDLDDYCDLVVKFIKEIGLDDPILIGHSHGGRVTIKLTADRLVDPPKIVLLDAAGLIPEKTPKQKRRAARFKRIKKFLSLPVINKFSGGLLKRARNHYGSADYNAAPPVLRKTLVSLVNTDLRDILPNIKCPSLLIWGEKDTATPLSDAKIMEKLIPDAGLCVLEGRGHFSFCEEPYRTNAILQSFIKREDR
ncbi:MAG: alpha/beta hydrolase [Clostridia bacterium]|nr:alpha/beta hydrolase [Clostridia bacterium]